MYTRWLHERCEMTLTITLTLAGSTSAECTQEALQLVGKKPLQEVARDDPEDALRVFIREKRRPYNDESPVCSAGHVEHKMDGVFFDATTDTFKSISCLPVILPLSSCAKAAIGISFVPGWSAHRSAP